MSFLLYKMITLGTILEHTFGLLKLLCKFCCIFCWIQQSHEYLTYGQIEPDWRERAARAWIFVFLVILKVLKPVINTCTPCHASLQWNFTIIRLQTRATLHLKEKASRCRSLFLYHRRSRYLIATLHMHYMHNDVSGLNSKSGYT